MKILYFSAHPNLYLSLPSGPGIHMREMIAAFKSLGHEVETCIMGQEPSPPAAATEQKKSLKQRLKPLIPSRLWESMKDGQLLRFDRYAEQELEEAIRRFQPDLIYERGYYLCVSGVRAAARMQVPLLLEMNAPYLEEKAMMQGESFLRATARMREREQITHCHRLIVVSSALREHYERNYPGCGPKTVVTPNAIRKGLHPPGQGEINALKTKLRLEDKTVVGFAGSIFPYHGVDKLIQAFARITAARDDLRLLIVGDGEILSELQTLAKDSGVAEKAVFTGRVAHEEVLTYMAAMDIALIPDQGWYMSPIKAFEYALAGAAILTADTGPVRDVMEDGVHARFTASTVDALVDNLEALIDQPALRASLARNFHEKVVREHHWEAMAEKILLSLEK